MDESDAAGGRDAANPTGGTDGTDAAPRTANTDTTGGTDEAVATAGGDVTITRMPLRNGGWIGYSDEAIFLDRGDDRVRIDFDEVVELARRTLAWDLAVMSVLLVGVGSYVVVNRNPIVGVAFALVGVLSLYRTYARRRGLVIRIENRPKPVTVYPAYPEECHETLVERVRFGSGR